MKLGQPLKIIPTTKPNARYFHNGGGFCGFHMVLAECDNDWACWWNPWPWGGVRVVSEPPVS